VIVFPLVKKRKKAYDHRLKKEEEKRVLKKRRIEKKKRGRRDALSRASHTRESRCPSYPFSGKEKKETSCAVLPKTFPRKEGGGKKEMARSPQTLTNQKKREEGLPFFLTSKFLPKRGK